MASEQTVEIPDNPSVFLTLRAAYNYPEDNDQIIDELFEDGLDQYNSDADPLTSILCLDAPFEHISLSLASFGTAAAPLEISERSRQGLALQMSSIMSKKVVPGRNFRSESDCNVPHIGLT